MSIPAPRLVLALATGIAALVWSSTLTRMHLNGEESVLDRLEAPLLDLRFQISGRRTPPGDVVIVAIDDEAVRQAGLYPLPRATMARLVQELARHRPRAVGLDILFLDQGPPEADADLASALRGAGAVVAAAGLFARDDPAWAGMGNGLLPVAERVLWPVEGVLQAATAGLVNISTDHAGTPRHVPLLVRAENTLLPSFPLQVASTASGRDPTVAGDRVALAGIVSRVDLGLSLPLRFYGPRGTIPTIGAGEVLEGMLPAERLRDRIVVVGATAIGTGDTFATPFDPVLPGVEVLATAVSHLRHGDGLVRDLPVRRVDAAAAVLLSLAAVLALALAPFSLALILAGLASTGWLVFAAVAFEWNYWFSASVPLAGMVPAAILCTLGRQVLDRRLTRRLEASEAALRVFHPPALVDRIEADPSYLAQPRAQQAAIVFIDLSRFTLLSEQLGPAQTRDLLRDYHALIEEEVTRFAGVVLSFMGDGAMIAFGLPESRPDDASRALQACIALVEGTMEWISGVSSGLGADIGVRVGAHYGQVVVSRLGPDTHQHITTTGDCVNVTSRLLEVAAREGVPLVASTDLLAAACEDAPGPAGFHSVHTVDIRGRRKPLRIALWTPDGLPLDRPRP